MDNAERIGKQIRDYRSMKRLTQRELARKSDLSINTINRYETGERMPTIYNLCKIAEALDVSVLDLVGAADASSRDNTKERQYITVDELRARAISGSVAYDRIEEIVEAQHDKTENLLSAFDRLNEAGQQKAVERVEELTEIPKYQKKPGEE